MANEHSAQLGDFIKGRMLFIEHYCRENGINFKEAMEKIEEETIRRAGTKEKETFLRERLFGGLILPTSILPNWLDKVFLEAMSFVLKGPNTPLFTTTSKVSCIPFEAGRFNAKRQAETIFKIMYQNRTPAEWLKLSFPVLYKKCYGEEAGEKLKIIEHSSTHFEIIADNSNLEKASRIDCSTTIGYVYGALEKLNARNILVTHDKCLAEAAADKKLCSFDITFEI
ncbi:MAG: hypothetical protein N2445_09030 [Acidobacteria bacterium]|nr:hypothetical protein [Acidobacteriota bacterium]